MINSRRRARRAANSFLFKIAVEVCPNSPGADETKAWTRATRKFPARIAGYRGKAFPPVENFIGKIKTRAPGLYCVWTVTFINDECEISDGGKAFAL